MLEELIKRGIDVTYVYYGRKASKEIIDWVDSYPIRKVQFKSDQKKFLQKIRILVAAAFNAKHAEFFYFERLIKVSGLGFLKHALASRFIYRLSGFIPLFVLHNVIGHFKYDTRKVKQSGLFDDVDTVLICPGNIREANETEFYFAAKELGIKVGNLVLSWDSTSTKGIYDRHYDYFICWHKYHKTDLVNLHGVRTKDIYVCGSLYHEWTLGKFLPHRAVKKSKTRQSSSFRGLWLGSSKNICMDEPRIIEEFHNFVSKQLTAVGVNLILDLRCHPSNA